MANPLNEDIEIFLQCDRFLTHHHRRNPREVLQDLADQAEGAERADFYGTGALIEDFEKEVALLLGKEAAVFLPSGTMAQLIALRIWCDRQKKNTFGLHPTSHLEKHEKFAYRELHHLRPLFLGEADRPYTVTEVKSCGEIPGALILELPYRELGGVLPPYAEVEELSQWSKTNHVFLHLDGARLWEAMPFYQKECREICALFDSVYVSFYKGLGGIAGAVLAGPTDFISEAKIWQHRQGGNLISLYPYVISARHSLRARLPRMPEYHLRAKEIANVLKEFPQIKVQPEVPQTNMMHLYFQGDLARIEAAFLRIAREKKMALFRKLERIPGSDLGKAELSVGDATMNIPLVEIRALFREVFAT